MGAQGRENAERLLLYLISLGHTLALLVNDTVCFMFTPLVVAVVRARQTAIAALPAGAGDEREHRQRVHAGRQSAKHDCRPTLELSFARFSASLLPVAAVGLGIQYGRAPVSAFETVRSATISNC